MGEVALLPKLYLHTAVGLEHTAYASTAASGCIFGVFKPSHLQAGGFPILEAALCVVRMIEARCPDSMACAYFATFWLKRIRMWRSNDIGNFIHFLMNHILSVSQLT